MTKLYILAALALLISCAHQPHIDWDSIDYGVPQRAPM